MAEYLKSEVTMDGVTSSVTAVQYREELIRDSFVNGISSNFIRQKRLETNDNLSFTKAFEIADTLHRAQQQSDEMSSVLRELAAASSGTARDVHPASTNSESESTTQSVGNVVNVRYRASSRSSRTCDYCGGWYGVQLSPYAVIQATCL